MSRRKANLSEHIFQCDYIYPYPGGYNNCVFEIGHDGPHGAYPAGDVFIDQQNEWVDIETLDETARHYDDLRVPNGGTGRELNHGK